MTPGNYLVRVAPHIAYTTVRVGGIIFSQRAIELKPTQMNAVIRTSPLLEITSAGLPDEAVTPPAARPRKGKKKT